MNILDELKVC